MDVKEYSDKFAGLFKEAVDLFEIDYDVFQRTTDETHKKNVENIWRFYKEKGYFKKKILKVIIMLVMKLLLMRGI